MVAGILAQIIFNIRDIALDSATGAWGGYMSNYFTNISARNYLLFVVILSIWFGLQAVIFSVIAIMLRLAVVRKWVAYVVPTIGMFASSILLIVFNLSDFIPQKALGPMIASPLEPWQYLVILIGEILIAASLGVYVFTAFPRIRGVA